MGIFNRKGSMTTGERLPKFIPTECVGEACPKFNGKNCTNPEMEWMTAGGPTEKRDKSKPPFKDEATYIIYGQRCLEGAAPELVAQLVEIFKPEEINMMQLVALTGQYGEIPVRIISGEQVTTIQTIASSE